MAFLDNVADSKDDELLDCRHIFAYTMGRVGTNAMFKVLQENYTDDDTNLISAHSLTTTHGIDHIPEGEPDVLAARKQTLKWYVDRGKTLYVISGVREPIRRALSSFFWFHNSWENLNLGEDAEKHLEVFLEEYNHDWALNWFDNEPKRFFGVDVYDYDFSPAQGYINITGEFEGELSSNPINLNWIIIKLSKFNQVIIRAIEQSWHCRLKNRMHFHENQMGKKKNSNSAYHSLMRELPMPKWYVEKMLNSKLAKHFFSETQIKRHKRAWLT